MHLSIYVGMLFVRVRVRVYFAQHLLNVASFCLTPILCISRMFACLFSFIDDDTPDQLNSFTNDSTFSIIVSIPIVGQIYRVTSANTINIISIISFHICCFFYNCCVSWLFFIFTYFLYPAKVSSVESYFCSVLFCVFFLLRSYCIFNDKPTFYSILFLSFAICHRVSYVYTSYSTNILHCNIHTYITLSLLSSK